ncbi:MAG: YcaQ family DNA glycosylase [Chloroflexi bacterium]|nr:YcaQ family DNA glycosylase [Chloroflexota bacterium]
MLELSLREARRLAIGAQLLAGPAPRRPTKRLMRETIRRLGALQIDSIHVVARSHHIVLWSRLGDHPQEWLHELLYPDRAVFEAWAHAAAFVPIELFPLFRRPMLEHADSPRDHTARWLEENADVLERVVSAIRDNGPVSTSAFEAPAGAGRAEAWAWHGNKPTNRALDLLWTNGVLMVDRREKFQRWYDLRERVLPAWRDEDLPGADAERVELGAIALAAMGVTTERWLPDYFRGRRSRIPRASAAKALEELVDRGTGTAVTVEGIGPAVAASALLDARIPPSRTTLLSPFDNLIWDRERTAAMFNFDLRLESYTPAPKRQYGYFSLPILYRDQLVGRLDPKAERRERVLAIKSIHLEPWFERRAEDAFYTSLAKAVASFRDFNGCETVRVEGGASAEAAARLAAALCD